jgi:hypothetical protein
VRRKNNGKVYNLKRQQIVAIPLERRVQLLEHVRSVDEPALNYPIVSGTDPSVVLWVPTDQVSGDSWLAEE